MKTTGTVILLPHMSVAHGGSEGVWVNDIHAQINRTLVTRVLEVASTEAVQEAIKTAESEGKPLSIAGGRHSMGAQQFGSDTILIDTRKRNKVIGFDRERGIVEVQAGVQWPKLISYLVNAQKKQSKQWGIAQKQTGADRLTLGGALAANIHGRGLTMRPFVSDVESFTMVDANGRLRECSRHQNKELFRLVAGGYGLFGFVTSIKLRLVTRRKLRRRRGRGTCEDPAGNRASRGMRRARRCSTRPPAPAPFVPQRRYPRSHRSATSGLTRKAHRPTVRKTPTARLRSPP
ncbi:MAG: FAD-binding protein [Planctomycetes bacterium]|nr:FAD-binding protein [Planctomycetota bacterium]